MFISVFITYEHYNYIIYFSPETFAIMFPGVNPKQMEQMMRQMGIKSEEIKAKRVIIEKEGE
ncbi:hypothetical protein COV61_03470, partial [Candidatus Micrarchaeota archaeon CG11_big_fil_rev_8_21_14_0_20_47_5]